MQIIWKYKIEAEYVQEIALHEDYKILTLQMQDNNPYIWVQGDKSKEKKIVEFRCIPTNSEFDDSIGDYVGTFQIQDFITLVFHVFAKVKGK